MSVSKINQSQNLTAAKSISAVIAKKAKELNRTVARDGVNYVFKHAVQSEIVIDPQGLTAEEVATRLNNLHQNGFSVESNNAAKLKQSKALYNIFAYLLIDARNQNIKNPVIIINFKNDQIQLSLHTVKKGTNTYQFSEKELSQCCDSSSILRNLLVPKNIVWKK